MATGYIYNASMYCDDCGKRIVAECIADGREDWEDSDTYPQSVVIGESDSTESCAQCGEMLDNRLTDDGREYVADRFTQYVLYGDGSTAYLDKVWTRYHDDTATDYQRLAAQSYFLDRWNVSGYDIKIRKYVR